MTDLARFYKAFIESSRTAHLATISSERALYFIYHSLLQWWPGVDFEFGTEESTYEAWPVAALPGRFQRWIGSKSAHSLLVTKDSQPRFRLSLANPCNPRSTNEMAYGTDD